jgi:hypothetical protein
VSLWYIHRPSSSLLCCCLCVFASVRICCVQLTRTVVAYGSDIDKPESVVPLFMVPWVKLVAAGQLVTATVPVFGKKTSVFGDLYSMSLRVDNNVSALVQSSAVTYPYIAYSHRNMWVDAITPSSIAQEGGEVSSDLSHDSARRVSTCRACNR